MEHDEETDFGAQMARIPGDFEQGLGGGAEQQVIHDLLVLQSQRGEAARKGENDVNVGGGQKFAATRLQPTVASGGLTLGTVSIATRVERDGTISAAGTEIAMPAQRGGAATLDSGQHFEVSAGDPVTTGFQKG